MIFSPTNKVVTVLKTNLLITLPAPLLERICSNGGAFLSRLSIMRFEVADGQKDRSASSVFDRRSVSLARCRQRRG